MKRIFILYSFSIVDVHIFKIREKLKPYGIKIKTIRGIGYMLEDDKK